MDLGAWFGHKAQPAPEPARDERALCLAAVRAYHRASKHHFHAQSAGPGELDWANQPDPFRRFAGAPLCELPLLAPTGRPSWGELWAPERIPAAAFDLRSLGALLQDSLGLTAWKQAGQARWSLRANPSSGNLHPTECYVLCGALEGLSALPALWHYAVAEHALEQRGQLDAEAWAEFEAALGEPGFVVGFSSIAWREAWKYGERAWRYCQHDLGHALAGLSLAAAARGWRAEALDGLAQASLAELLATDQQRGLEREQADSVLLLRARASNRVVPTAALERALLRLAATLRAVGLPNQLSEEQVEWAAIEAVTQAVQKPQGALETLAMPDGAALREAPLELESTQDARALFAQRRSALAFDGRGALEYERFLRLCARLAPDRTRAPFESLPTRARVDLLLFVHRVSGLESGLYLLARCGVPARERLCAQLRPDFLREVLQGLPAGLELLRLWRGDLRGMAAQLCCYQDIGSTGALAIAMLAEFEAPLEALGPALYPRLFWECGALGQVLYLEAEAAGLRATGVGCYFDDPTLALLGLSKSSHQSLYHFTLGGPVEDRRILTQPPYPQRASS